MLANFGRNILCDFDYLKESALNGHHTCSAFFDSFKAGAGVGAGLTVSFSVAGTSGVTSGCNCNEPIEEIEDLYREK